MSTTSPTGATQTGYSYDEAGNTKTMGPTGSAQTFTYDVEGHVASATDAAGKVSTYIYDADGNRIITKDPTGETLTVGDLELFVPAGDTHAVGKRVYSHNGQPVAELDATTGLTWLLNDNQGTTYATVNAGNLAVSKRWQDPYGTTRGAAASTWPDKHGYLGGYQNTTGLTHLGARDYDPTQGRFTSVDPVLDAEKPQQLNGYAYGFGDPVSNPDPTGLEPLNSECVGSDMAACESYYYGNWDGPVLQRINLSAAIDWHWHSSALGALGELGLRESERYYHPHGASKSSWKDLVGVVANIAVFAGCEVVTAPETAGLSTVGCGALAGAVSGGAQAAVDGDNILAGIGEGGLLGLLEGLGGLAAKSIAAKAAGKVGDDTPGEMGSKPASDSAGAAVHHDPRPAMTDVNVGQKWGKHSKDYALNPSDPDARAWYVNRVKEVRSSQDEVRQGPWNPEGGGGYDYWFYRKGGDLVLTKGDGSFVTMFPMGEGEMVGGVMHLLADVNRVKTRLAVGEVSCAKVEK
ncbi:MAG: repeat-containing protein [Amycolatopsis sp.]|uniref:RHS repeat domain-containing protein n=1 Tax=Amycolatopsis sp. TaxID=37632 RepID=UPI0026366CDF|nr:RHS repeat-associated core domain-containing protein [Amycolatopsis sp.]MCU1681798.1 repeat-containing protein [Amycolatopsis sp.]